MYIHTLFMITIHVILQQVPPTCIEIFTISITNGVMNEQTFIWTLSLGGWLVFMATVPLLITLPHIFLLHLTGKIRLVAVVLNWWGLMGTSGLKLFRSGS